MKEDAITETERKIEILSAADQLDARWYLEEHIDESVNYLIWALGVFAVHRFGRKTPHSERQKPHNRIGRPRKLRSELKPVRLYLQVKMLRDFFEKTEGVALSQREAVKLLIKSGEIPQNSELSHVEKQISAGKKCLDEMKKELLSRWKEMGTDRPKPE